MRNLFMFMFMCTSFASPLAMAAGSKIDISSPMDGAKLDAKAQNKMDYNITLGSDGDHIHVFVDGKQAALLREMKGSYSFESLAKGKREICIRIVNKNHTPIDVERCIKVTVE